MAALADLPDLAARISSGLSEADIPHAITGAIAMASHGYVRATQDLVVLKMLWHRAKDVPDVHALIATTADLDARYITETLAGILPEADPRHAEIADLLERFGPE